MRHSCGRNCENHEFRSGESKISTHDAPRQVQMCIHMVQSTLHTNNNHREHREIMYNSITLYRYSCNIMATVFSTTRLFFQVGLLLLSEQSGSIHVTNRVQHTRCMNKIQMGKRAHIHTQHKLLPWASMRARHREREGIRD